MDRPVGGRIPGLSAFFHDLISNSDRQHWFALYAKGTLSAFTFVEGIRHGNFRLHPVGRMAVSEGCITLSNLDDFMKLSAILLAQPTANIPGTKIRYYGTVTVQ